MILIGTDIEPVQVLADALGAKLVTVPMLEPDADWRFADELSHWRSQAASSGAEDHVLEDHVVVAPWWPDPTPASFAEMHSGDWVRTMELPLATWAAALGVAARSCADGGAIVAVVDRAAPLDCAGWGAVTAVCDGVEALVRSLARAEGARRVRVNGVTTPARLGDSTPANPAPSLQSFPGTVAQEAVGSVRLLLADDASGITGTIIDADCGRAWR
jgi:NAD(P)-dependent dehydrogenase (short-subunit alcohol dehydrogenase family)